MRDGDGYDGHGGSHTGTTGALILSSVRASGLLEARLPWTTTAPLTRHAGMELGLRQYVNGAWWPAGQIFWVRVSVSGRVGQVVVTGKHDDKLASMYHSPLS